MIGNSRPDRVWILALAVALLGPAFAGCVTPGSGETGTGAFYVKDAPEDDWSHVNVTFTSVRVHMGGEDGGNESDGEWITVAENETGREVDLLAFSAADARSLLGSAELENGTYNQVLINVTEAYGVDKDSGDREDFTLTRPQLRLTRAWHIEANQTTHVIADLDLDRSIVQQGDGEYRFNPVIGQVVVETNDEEPRSQRGDSTQAGDGGDPTDVGPGGNGSMTTYVKDAPTDEFDEVWLNISQIEVHYAGNGSTNATEENGTDANESDGEWITTVNETREVDLLKFNETGSKAFLGEADVPTGRYTQIRILVNEAYGVDNNGTEVDITMSSSTARVVRSWNVSDNGTTAQVTIDLDLDRSLVKQGGGGQGQAPDGQASWRMTPVIGTVLVDHVLADPMQDQPDAEDAAEDATSSNTETGEATAYVKDAPANLSEVWITFTEVRVHHAGADDATENATGNETDGNETVNETDGEWRTIFEGNRSVDLLNFSENGSKAFLGDAELPTGQYTQIRLNLSDAWAVNDTGAEVNVTIVNEMAKVNRPFTITANETTQIVIDVDLDRSLHAQGGQGQGGGSETTYRLTPVIGSVQVDRVGEDPRSDTPDAANDGGMAE